MTAVKVLAEKVLVISCSDCEPLVVQILRVEVIPKGFQKYWRLGEIGNLFIFQ